MDAMQAAQFRSRAQKFIQQDQIKTVEKEQSPQTTSEIKEIRQDISILKDQINEVFNRLFTGNNELAETPEPKSVRYLSIAEIIGLVCTYYPISRTAMLSPSRTAIICRFRHIAMYLAKTHTLKSLPEIGRRFTHRDHTTVLHGVRKIANLRLCDWELCYDLVILEQNINERALLPPPHP